MISLLATSCSFSLLLRSPDLGFFVQRLFIGRIVGRVRAVVKLVLAFCLPAEHLLFALIQMLRMRIISNGKKNSVKSSLAKAENAAADLLLTNKLYMI